MARIPRIEALDYPHHVIQRGNRNQDTFFNEQDMMEYLEILKLQKKLFGFDVWAYCLMSNHVHLIVVPRREGSMIQGIAETNRLYTRMINFRYGWRGYLWQGRFKSFVMDGNYLLEAVRYVEMNPVKANIRKKAEDYKYSSACSHIYKIKNEILDDFYLLDEVSEWRMYLNKATSEEITEEMKKSELTGRPLGSKVFLEKLENLLGRTVIRKKPGPQKML